MRRYSFDADDEPLLQPVIKTGPGFFLAIAVLGIIIAWGIYAWLWQLDRGLGVTGMNTPIYWGLYVTNFVFFIGISHAGTLISGILRVTRAEWRRPITRAAEAITVFALFIGASQIIFDMGRPERILNVILYGRLQSPILWDVISILTYMVASITYLYLPLIPDLAYLRDRLTYVASWRRKLYGFLAWGWSGTEEQKRLLNRAIGIMAVLIIPIAVSVHTVVSWIFGMTLRPMWHSTIFGPYFVTGAIYSGIASIIIAMAIIRKVFRLEDYLKPLHFNYLGLLLITLNTLWFYFTFAEYLTTGYGNVPVEMQVFNAKFTGEFRLIFWSMVTTMVLAFILLVFPRVPVPKWMRLPALRARPVVVTVVIAAIVALAVFVQRWLVPELLYVAYSDIILRVAGAILLLLFVVAILPYLGTRIITSTVVASVLVNIGMWLERFTIIIPTETRPMLEGYPMGVYHPTWVEWSITAASFSSFILLYVVFTKIFPIISIWEVKEAKETIPRVMEKLESYLPGPQQ